MTRIFDDVMPNAADCRKALADADAAKAAEAARAHAQAEAEKAALLERLSKPSGLDDEKRLELAAAIVKRAVANGLTEVQVIRFPSQLCTDRGRAINNREPGWEETLTGLPKEMYEFWRQHLRPRGFKAKAQVVDFPNGVPGDIGITLSWA